MKRWIGAVVAAVTLLHSSYAACVTETSARCAILMEASSGRILYEKHAHEPRLIASTTKLMTALVAVESGHAGNEMVTIVPEWTGAEGSSLYLRPGEQVELETLLYGMLLRSGNDAALAVAGHCAGSVDAFVAAMNEKAAQLGMKDSHFENPNGLDGESHVSSAYDMALLARACLEREEIARIAATKSITLGTRTFTNHNKLLWQYEGCIGLKTGYTKKAGRTLVSAARRDGMTLICVTLNAPNDWADHAALFDYGFSQYRVQEGTREGEILCRVPVVGSLIPFCPVTAGESVRICLARDEDVRRELNVTATQLSAPVLAGTQIGEAVFYQNDVECARVPLLAGRDCRDDRAQPSRLPDWLPFG